MSCKYMGLEVFFKQFWIKLPVLEIPQGDWMELGVRGLVPTVN